MSTHGAVFFRQNQRVMSTLYLHSIQPEDFHDRFAAFVARAERESHWGTRFDDPGFLAAKFVVYWAEWFYRTIGKRLDAQGTLDFPDLGIYELNELPPVFYHYYVDCDFGGHPRVILQSVDYSTGAPNGVPREIFPREEGRNE